MPYLFKSTGDILALMFRFWLTLTLGKALSSTESAAALAVANTVVLVSRLAPVSGLSAVERNRWLAAVNSRPADWFGEEHAPMLLNYVRLLSVADTIADQLANFDPDWLNDEDGLRRYDRLNAAFTRTTGQIKTLAVTMRLTQQSVYNAKNAGTASSKGRRGPKPWQQTIEG